MSDRMARLLSCCGLLWLLCGCTDVSSCASIDERGLETAELPEPGQLAPFRPH